MALLRRLPPDIDANQRQCHCRRSAVRNTLTRLRKQVATIFAISLMAAPVFTSTSAAQPSPPDLEVIKSVEPTSLHPGELGKYTIEVKYNGAGTAAGVMLSDLVPAGLVVTNTNPPATGSGTLTWDLGSIASGASKSVEVEFVVTTDAIPKGEVKTVLMNAATAESEEPELVGSSETVNLEVSYATGPFIMCPDDVLITDSCPTEFPKETYGMATAVDPCDPEPDITYKDTTVVDNGPGCKEFIRTWTATNDSGCFSTCEQKFKIDSSEPPVIDPTKLPGGGELGCNPAESLFPDCEELKKLVVVTGGNCGGDVTINCESAETGDDCSKTRTYTLTAVNACGDVSEPVVITYTYRIDRTPPTFKCPEGEALGCNPPPDKIPTVDSVKAMVEATATDNCGGGVTAKVTIASEQTLACLKTVVFRVIVSDNCGNDCTECLITYSWKFDDVAPVINGCPVDKDYGCDYQSVPTLDDIKKLLTVTDNCDTNLVATVTEQNSQSGCNYTRTFTATAVDTCGKAAEPCVVTFTWRQDDVAPVIEGCPQGGDLGCNPASIPTLDEIKAKLKVTDNCDTDLVANVTEENSQGTGCSYTRKFTATAIDTCENAAVPCVVTYTWKQDEVAPTIEGCPQGGDLGCNPTSIPTREDIENLLTVTDNCDTGLVATVVEDNTSQGCEYTRTFTATAMDSCENAAVPCVVTYTWKQDTVKPMFNQCPTAPIVLPCNSPAPTCDSAEIKAITATDVCDGIVKVICHEPVLGGTPCMPELKFRLTATDSCMNTNECFVTYTWPADNEPPTLVGVPADVTVKCGEDIPEPANVTATDNCTQGIMVDFDEVPSDPDCTGAYTITRTWTAVDACMKSASKSQTITVEGCPAQVSGFVYVDDNDNGLKEAGEDPIADVKITLTGKDCEGNDVMRMTTTDATGFYSFTNLPPSDAAGYTCTETQPAGYLDGKDAKNNVVIANSNMTDVISGIVVGPGDHAENNNFGELLSCGLEITKTCDPCEVEELLPADCTTLGKPFTITFIYTGGGCAASNNDQMSDSCSGSVDPTEPVTISAPDNDDYVFQLAGTMTWSPTLQLNPGDMFTMAAPTSPSGKVDPNSRFVLTNDGGSEDIRFHTSCSEPMGAGDSFGSLTIYAMNGYTGKTTITYTYVVKNNGGDVTNVNIEDDKLGHIAGPFDLAAGDTSEPFTKKGEISETTTNKATVTGDLVNGTVCEDEMEITVTVNKKKCCLLVMDASSLNSGLSTVQQAAALLSVDPSFLVNEDQAAQTASSPLRWNELKPGDIVTIPAGSVGDEGIFALPANTNFDVAAFEAGTVPQDQLSTVTGLMPLRNHDIFKMVGQRFVAVVYEKDINVDYKPIAGCLQGERTGKFSFTVLNVLVPGNLPESSSSNSLYELVVRVEEPAEAEQVLHVKTNDKEPDNVTITKATYNSSNGTLSVFATSSYGSQSLMTLSVDGYIKEAPMKYQSTTKRYEYVMPYPVNLSGMKVMISTNKGGAHNTIIK